MASRQVPMLSLEAAKIAAEGAQEKARQMGMGTLNDTHIVSNTNIHLN